MIYSNVPELLEAFRQKGLTNLANIYRTVAGALFGRDIPEIEGQYFAPDLHLDRWMDIRDFEMTDNCT